MECYFPAQTAGEENIHTLIKALADERSAKAEVHPNKKCASLGNKSAVTSLRSRLRYQYECDRNIGIVGRLAG